MDGHPIPQDVTGFQFKLIGAMTIKQFAYVGIGVVISVIIYYSPVNIFFKILLIPLFGLGGTILAFVPIEGRPIDVMFFNFIKSLFVPNQFIYQKNGGQLSFTQPLPTGNSSDISTIKTQNKLDEKEQAYISSVAATTADMTQAPISQPQVATLSQPASLQEPEQPTVQQQTISAPPAPPQPSVQQIAVQPQQTHVQDQALPKPPLASSPIQVTLQQPAKTTGALQPSDTPNVVMGIVKDSRGNVLSGMLVEIKDKDGNPVRAFKTNPLGQFSSATPLSPGNYSMEIEDPKAQHNFNPITITTNNQILLPIEAVSHDAREELRKELFN